MSEFEYTISKAPHDGNDKPEIIALFKYPTDRDDFFDLLETKFEDVNWIKDED